MSERFEEGQSDAPHHSKIEDDPENYKVQPPDKKKYEEEMEKLLSQIKDKETEADKLKSLGNLSVSNELHRIKAEKSAAIAQRKKIDQELEKLKKIIPDKMRQLGQLESSLIYKSEEKINTAIQRLEWNLKVQPFKLMEEKKIVSEIDRLKRSKKTLVQYMALKQDIAGIRDMQRGMREERDVYFQAVGKLNAQEERLRRDIMSARATLSVLKLQIDQLHETKRNLVASHKKQMEEFQGAKDKQKKGSWKKREDYKKSAVTDRRRQLVNLEVEKSPHDKHISWCNSLIKVLSCYSSLASQEPSSESLSPASSVEEPELAEEIDDGQYVLLKKPDEGFEQAAAARRPNKKNRRPRKQSSVRKVTLSPDMVQQLMELGLKAPNSISEVSEAIDSLKLKKILLEQEQQASDVASDAGVSATESLMCEISRQVSKTESFEGTADTNPGDQLYAEIISGCLDEQDDQPEGYEAPGAVGGCEVLSEIFSPSSDSTVEGDAGSVASQSSVCDSSENAVRYVSRSETVRKRRDILPAEVSEHSFGKVKTSNLTSAQRRISEMMVSYVTHGYRTTDNNNCLPDPRHEELSKASAPTIEAESPSLCTEQCFKTGHQDVPATSSCDFPALTPKRASPPESLSHIGKRSVWKMRENPPLQPVQPANSILPASSSVQPQGTSASVGQVQNTAIPAPYLLSGLTLDSDDFPSLSESFNRPRQGSNISMRSSCDGSAQAEQLSHPCDPDSDPNTCIQITDLIRTAPACTQRVFHVPLSCPQQIVPVSVSIPAAPRTSQIVPLRTSIAAAPLTSQKFPGSLPNADRLLPMSQIPSVDKSSTEKWVESSVAYIKDLIPDHFMDPVTAAFTESTRL